MLDHAANTMAALGHTALFIVTHADASISVARDMSRLWVRRIGHQSRRSSQGVPLPLLREVSDVQRRTAGRRPCKARPAEPAPCPEGPDTGGRPHRSLALITSKVNYERFNGSNISIRSWSWNYRGCWHQTDPPVDTHCSVCVSIHC